MPALPSGTVTFLFTDIEGSTKLWEQHPEAMRGALARHDTLMRAAIDQHDGIVFKTVGDAFCAAFHTAPDALSAALAAQQALHTEVWLEPVTLKVRMALHTGAAVVSDNDYFGQPLNRVARLLSVGYGGQVLISAATQELVRDALPPNASLMSLGEHRLRDLTRTEVVFQLAHPGLPVEFLPLRSLDNPALPNNLPRQLTSFIGREKEIVKLTILLEKSSLLTLTGSGGCGKTRLALQVVADVLDQYPNGVWLVELASLADPGLVAQAVASVLGVREQAGQPIQQTLIDSLKSKHLLLMLDNCEHLLLACANLVSALLRVCPNVKVLATSREALGIGGEQTYRVPSLSLPDPQLPSSPQSVSQYEAVRLFIERAMLVKTDFAVTNANAPALAQVCSRLDGIPLAIELAAARVRSMPVEDINARLDNRFRLLTGGDRAALPRQQTLRALIDWSYELLNEREKLLLARLSVFAGGWTLATAEPVGAGESAAGGGIEAWEVLDLLISLADKSLVISEEQNSSARYRMLGTVREYAAERLQASGETAPVRTRHRDTFLVLAEEAEPKLRGPEQQDWLDRLESEHDNLRAALAWCTADEEGAEAGLRLSGSLSGFWNVRGHWSEGREHLERALGREGAQDCTSDRARALQGAGLLAAHQDNYMAARTLTEESLRLYRELGDKRGIANTLIDLGFVAIQQGDYGAARTQFEAGLHLFRELGDKSGIAWSLIYLCCVEFAQGDFVVARNQLEASRHLFREVGDKGGIAWSLIQLGRLALAQGDYTTARTQLQAGLHHFRELGDKRGIANTLEKFASALAAQADDAQATRLWGAAAAVRQSIGSPLPPNEREKYEDEVAQARTALGDAAFTAAFEEGRAMTWETAVALALGESQE